MARAKTVFMICPQGHSFITLQSFGYTFTCPECDLSFDNWLGNNPVIRSSDHRVTLPRLTQNRRALRPRSSEEVTECLHPTRASHGGQQGTSSGSPAQKAGLGAVRVADRMTRR